MHINKYLQTTDSTNRNDLLLKYRANGSNNDVPTCHLSIFLTISLYFFYSRNYCHNFLSTM